MFAALDGGMKPREYGRLDQFVADLQPLAARIDAVGY